MKIKTNAIIVGLLFMLSSFTVLHKYYVSVTDIEYSSANKSLQVTSRLFIDDFQNVLQERYGASIKLDDKTADVYVEKYFKKKFSISVNGTLKGYTYIGKEFNDDMLQCYFEVEDIDDVQSVTITNKLLMDLYEGQQNITHITINDKKKSFLLIKENTSGVLKL